MPWAATSAWKIGDEYDAMRGCDNAREGGNMDNREVWEQSCKGDIGDSHWKGKGRGTWFRCARACGSNVGYQAGRSGHPCDGASFVKGIPTKIDGWKDQSGVGSSFTGDSHGAFFCQYPDTPEAMVAASGRLQNNVPTADNKTMYHQLIYGTNIGNKYTSPGFCEVLGNLPKVVHKDGRTCFDMLKDGISQSVAEINGRQYCVSNRTDPKCRCINVSDPGFLQTCKSNPSWAGCAEINKAVSEFEKAGLKSATGLFGNADCLVPQLCHGSNLYQPESKPGSCANKMAICNQVLALDNITSFAGVSAVQGCEINFEAEQAKKDAAKKSIAEAAIKAEADRVAAEKAAADRAAADRAAADRAAADRATADRAAADRATADRAAADRAAADRAAADRAAADKAAADNAVAAKAAADKAAEAAKAAGASPAEIQAAADKASAEVIASLPATTTATTTLSSITLPNGSIINLPDGITTTQAGIGGGIILILCCCCCIVLILMMSSGGEE